MTEEKNKNNVTFNVLVVEDNIAHAELIIRSLTDTNPNILISHVDDGELALDFVLHTGRYAPPQEPPIPDLILLDLKLPKVSGHAVLYNLKNDDVLKSIPVIMLTTSDADTDVSTAYENRANSYITKPIDFEEFTDMITEVANYWLKENQRRVTTIET